MTPTPRSLLESHQGDLKGRDRCSTTRVSVHVRVRHGVSGRALAPSPVPSRRGLVEVSKATSSKPRLPSYKRCLSTVLTSVLVPRSASGPARVEVLGTTSRGLRSTSSPQSERFPPTSPTPMCVGTNGTSGTTHTTVSRRHPWGETVSVPPCLGGTDRPALGTDGPRVAHFPHVSGPGRLRTPWVLCVDETSYESDLLNVLLT